MKPLLKNICLIGIVILGLPAISANAVPLPAGTKINLTQGVGSAPNVPCSSGSCFYMMVAPGFYVWVDIAPGADGGYIVGKAQKCGTQELDPSPANTTPSELTAAWLFFSNYGTFCTDPGGEQNIFDDASCTGAACLGRTELKYLYAVWNGNKIPLGSSVGCVLLSCTADQKAGIFVTKYQLDSTFSNIWSLEYNQIVPSGQFVGVPFGIVLRAPVAVPCSNCPPVAGNINLVTYMGSITTWIPVVGAPDGNPLTCRIGSAPANGSAVVANNCSYGTYQSDLGFIGIDSFTYISNSGSVDSAPGSVTVSVEEPTPTPTPSVISVSIVLLPGQTAQAEWKPVVPNMGGTATSCRIGTPPANGTATIASDCSIGTYRPDVGFIGIDSFTYISNNGILDSAPVTVHVAVVDGPTCIWPPHPPTPIYKSAVTGETITWYGGASDCTISQPSNGIATVNRTNCTGTYTSNAGFTGRDTFSYSGYFLTAPSHCGYTSNVVYVDVCPAPGCVTPTPTPTPVGCSADYPISQFTQTGKQGTLSITFTGNITSHTNKEVKVCPGTTLSYTASSTKDLVKCKVKNSLTSGNGTLRIRDHLKCTDKPLGKDKLNFKIKSGVK